MVEKKKIENPVLQIRVSHELEDRLNRVAVMYGVSRNEIARIAIAQYVGQVTGALDQMVSNQTLDYEKLVDAMLPKLIEAEKQMRGSQNEG